MHAIEIKNLNKSYNNGFQALENINLSVNKGEIFALLGPNGAGKSTLINIVCGITKKTHGQVKIFGKDNISEYKKTRTLIGLVPQEIATDSFEKVINTLKFSRGLFNKPRSEDYLNFILKNLDLFEKKNNQIRTLSGGMKRRVMIAKALSHEPKILFLDEPTAGVDVSLRKNLWKLLNQLRNNGVTIFLTTHYIEEAENIADRISVIHKGKIIITEKKKKILKKLGKKKITVTLKNHKQDLSKLRNNYNFLKKGKKIILFYDSNNHKSYAADFLYDLAKNSIRFESIDVVKSNLEEIFLDLVRS